MRRVRRLQLTAPSDALRRRAQLLLEDALRTASLPGAEDVRLWLVRSLHLGVIDPRFSSAQLARSIEERIQRAGLITCAGGDPAAAQADVVVFASALEASIALAVRLGRGEPVRGWHWPLAVPAYRPGLAAAESLRALLRASAELPGAAAASAAWLEAVVEAGAVEPLLASLSAAEAVDLLRLAGWEPAASLADLAADRPAPSPPLSPAWRGVLARWLPRWGAEDPRGLWLVAMALVARQPTRLGSAELPRQVRAWLRAVAQAQAAADRPAPAAQSGAISSSPDRAPPRAPEAPRPDPESTRGERQSPQQGGPDQQETIPRRASHLPPRAGAAGPAPGSDAHRQDAAAESSVQPEPPDPASGGGLERAASPRTAPPPSGLLSAQPGQEQISNAAGLAFLVLLLRRQGLEIWLERHPALLDADWPRRLLRSLADDLGAAPHDPLRTALGLEALEPLPTTATTPFDDPAVLAAVSRHWRRRLRRWCQRPGRLTLGRLVRRPGVVVASRTHVELWFQPRQAEIVVRRHGLDLDPGWVPWLARVISFHYERRGPGDAEG